MSAPRRPGPRARIKRGLALAALAAAALAAASACRDDPKPAPAPAAQPAGIIDAHLHLTDEAAAPELIALLDRHGVDRGVVLASPNQTSGRPGKGLEGYREGNEVVLRAAAAHPRRLIPFVTLDLAADSPAYLDELRQRGACGVKLYQGHHTFHDRPLDDPAHRPLYEAMERLSVPVLLHVNTVRYRDELARVLRAFPRLRMLCPHLCGSRTNLDRFEALRDEFPSLLFDLSHGSSEPAAEGFSYLERERDRLRRILEQTPDRFLFGSDLVTTQSSPSWREEWDMQAAANLGLLRAERFTFWRKQLAALAPGEYRGLALPPELLRPVLGDNAARWLGSCLAR